MIDILTLKDSDKGRYVILDTGYSKNRGKIKSWNDKVIFVVYLCDGNWDNYADYTAEGTNPSNLSFECD